MKQLQRMSVVFAMLAVLPALGGTVINTKPAIGEDGYYEIGYTPATDTAKSVYDWENYATYFGYVDWAALGFAAGDKVRLTGNVLLASLPTNLTYDWSMVKKIVFSKYNIVPAGSTFTVPENAQFCYTQGNVTTSGSTFTFEAKGSGSYGTVPCDLVVNGTAFASTKSSANTTFSGKISGTGTFQIEGFYGNQVTLTGELTGSIEFRVEASYGGGFIIKTKNANPTMAYFYSNAGDGIPKGKTSTYAQFLEFKPNRSEPTTLSIAESKSSQFASTSLGDQWKVAAGHTIKATKHSQGNLVLLNSGTGSGLIHLGKYGSSANNGTIYVKNNANVTVDDFHWSYDHAVSYASFSPAVNTNTLDFSKSSSYGTVTITGATPAKLPRKILCHKDKTSAVTLKATASDWTFPIDFGATGDAVNPNRCEGMGKLSIPSSGTITITNATALASATAPSHWTEYPLFTCTTGGEALANMTVNFAGSWNGIGYETVVRPTGLYLRAKSIKGLQIIIH